MFIELNEWYYDTDYHGYYTRLLAVNPIDISSIFEINERAYDAVRICMKNGRYHDVKETYKEILEKLTKEILEKLTK